MSGSAPASPVPSPPRSNDLGRKRRVNVPSALLRWSVSSAAKIAVKTRPGIELDPRTLDAVSAACTQLVTACASASLARGPVGRTARLSAVEHTVCSMLWRPRVARGHGMTPDDTLARRAQTQAREMATQCSGAAALQPAVTCLLVDAARRGLVANCKVCCDGCDEQAIAYLGATADFVCSEMLTAAVGQAEQECCRRVLPCHLNAALMADRELVEAWPHLFGTLEVGRQPVPFSCARFGSYDRPIRDCPMVVFEDDEQLDECVFGAVAVVRLSDRPKCSFASRARDAQRAGAILLILICSDDLLFEPSCQASESDGLTIPVAIVAHCDQSLFHDDGTVSLSLNVHGLAMYGQKPKLTKAKTGDALRSLSSEAASTLPMSISPDASDEKQGTGRRQSKRATFLPVSSSSDRYSSLSSDPSAKNVDLSGVVARLYPDGKRAKKSTFEGLGEGFSLPSLVPKPTQAPTL